MKFGFGIECYGVRVGARLETAERVEAARKAVLERFPADNWKDAAPESVEYLFTVTELPGGAGFEIELNGDAASKATCISEKLMYDYLDRNFRLTVAEFAPGHVFIHAGAVAWRGQGIVFPARSFGGKSTLTTEFIRRGAEYYSDDYAVIDEEGRLHPFARPVSVRDDPGNKYLQRNVGLDELGASIGREPVPVALFVMTRFVEDGKWNPVRLSPGTGILEMLSHTIPTTYKPEFTLRVLNNTVKHAIILQSDRGEAEETADQILSLIENPTV